MRLMYLFLLIGFSLSAQIKGVVKDKTGSPIPYVNIVVENKNLGVASEEDGSFSLDLKEDRNLIFSALGFETIKIKASQATVVVLNEKIFDLEGITIVPRKGILVREIKGSKRHHYFSPLYNYPYVFAKHFSVDASDKGINFLKEAVFYTESKVEKGIYKVRIYEVKHDGSPGEDVLLEDLVVEAKKGKNKNIVDLSKFNLKIPKEGIFIGFEFLILDRNKLEEKYTNKKTKEVQINISHYPFVASDFLDEGISYFFGMGEWVLQGKSVHHSNSDKKEVIAPAIDLTLTN